MERDRRYQAGIEPRRAVLALLAARAPGRTVCPSEVARALAAAVDPGGSDPDWRDEMAAVHAAVDALVAEGKIRLSWKGVAMPVRAGPYRIGRAAAADDTQRSG